MNYIMDYYIRFYDPKVLFLKEAKLLSRGIIKLTFYTQGDLADVCKHLIENNIIYSFEYGYLFVYLYAMELIHTYAWSENDVNWLNELSSHIPCPLPLSLRDLSI